MTYLIYRCGCGRVLYSREDKKTRKCVCGKTLKVKERRIFKKVKTIDQAITAVQDMQEEIHGGPGFISANKL
ncbi:MAG: DUF1922 domain-containing protein [Methanobacteriaceae archaeon]|nr:DUF1922 domain-containing protein [Methanobacteriaceae archaeon]